MKNFEPIFANDGYRPNVGIVLCNENGMVFWARRVNHDGWQFPQGGVSREESLEQAMYRELEEETGLQADQVRLVAHTSAWLHYDLPKRMLRNQSRAIRRRKIRFKGQKQIWFLLELLDIDSAVNLSSGTHTAEFDHWKWVDTSFALDNIVDFKQAVYRQVFDELGPYIPKRPN